MKVAMHYFIELFSYICVPAYQNLHFKVILTTRMKDNILKHPKHCPNILFHVLLSLA